MKDIIRITSLSVACHIGVTDQERRAAQFITIDIALHCSASIAGSSDQLGETVDYSRLADCIRLHVTQSTCKLIETLAENLAAISLQFSNLVDHADVRVTKPGILKGGGSASVEISRHR